MKHLKRIIIGIVIMNISTDVFSQQTPPTQFSPAPLSYAQQKQELDSVNQARIQKEKQTRDSIQRKLMKDSVGLSDQVITQVFAARDNYINQAEQIRLNATLSQGLRTTQLELLRKQTTEATKELMGALKYEKYLDLLTGQ